MWQATEMLRNLRGCIACLTLRKNFLHAFNINGLPNAKPMSLWKYRKVLGGILPGSSSRWLQNSKQGCIDATRNKSHCKVSYLPHGKPPCTFESLLGLYLLLIHDKLVPQPRSSGRNAGVLTSKQNVQKTKAEKVMYPCLTQCSADRISDV